jgi:hypothetical protein
MGMYALGTRPLIESLANEVSNEQIIQVWFADDSTSGGNLGSVRKWWDHLKENGPKYGYYPKPTKTHIIVKDTAKIVEVQEIFSGEGIKITVDGQRHIGAALGTEAFKKWYVENKVKKWIKDVEDLADLAEEEPQAAFSAFNTSIAHRWTFLQRVVEDISELFEPLETAIREKLIPALVGKPVSELERERCCHYRIDMED